MLTPSSGRQPPHSGSLFARVRIAVRPKARTGVVCCIALACAATPMLAQGASVFTGQVVADSSFEPLPGAQVTLVELDRHAEAASDGAFRFADLPAAEFTVRIRLLGYAAQSVRIRLDGRDSLVRDFLLVRSSTPLPEVAVTARGREPVAPNLVEFERRRARGEGRYLTPEQVERDRARKLSDVLRKIPGLYVLRLKNGVTAISSARGTISISRPQGGRCYATIFLDGIQIYADRPGSPPMNIDEITTSEIAAVEYYAGAARMPPELNGVNSACGVLMLWTRLK